MQVQILSRMAQIGALDPHAHGESLVLQLADLHVSQLDDPGPELPDELEVLGHVRGQYHANDDIADVEPVLQAQTGEQVAARPLHETVDCGAVHVFQHAVVVVLQRQVVLDVDQEAIRDSWVGHVVAQASEDAAQQLQGVKFGHQVRVPQEVQVGVQHVRPVAGVVVGIRLVGLCGTYVFQGREIGGSGFLGDLEAAADAVLGEEVSAHDTHTLAR